MRLARPRSAALLAVLVLLLLATGVSPSPAAAAAVRDVQLTQDGPVPRQLTVEAGDRVRFINTDSFVHRAASSSGNWSFDTGTLPPRGTFTVEEALTPGTYTYRGAGLDRFEGSVVVPGTASPAPARTPSAAPRPSPAAPVVPVPGRSPSPSTAPAPEGSAAAPAQSTSPAPVATGGTGVVQGPPPLAGSSFGGFDGLAPPPAPGAPAPLVAPEVPLGAAAPLAVATPDAGLPLVAEQEQAAPVTAAGELPRLSSPVQARRFGLPLALATLSIVGVASLLARLLLAEAPGADGPAAA